MLRCLGRSRGWEEEGLEKEALEGPVEALEGPPTRFGGIGCSFLPPAFMAIIAHEMAHDANELQQQTPKGVCCSLVTQERGHVEQESWRGHDVRAPLAPGRERRTRGTLRRNTMGRRETEEKGEGWGKGGEGKEGAGRARAAVRGPLGEGDNIAHSVSARSFWHQ